MLARMARCRRHCGCGTLTLGSAPPRRGASESRPEYFMRLPAGLGATGETELLDELLDY